MGKEEPSVRFVGVRGGRWAAVVARARQPFLDEDPTDPFGRVVMEEHLGTALGQHSVESQLGLFCTSEP